jgi:hypothetical protein
MPSETPRGPWQMLATDLLQVEGKNYLVTVDYYSEYIHVDNLEKGTESIRRFDCRISGPPIFPLQLQEGLPYALNINHRPVRSY